MLVQLSSHTIKSTTAQTFENAEKVENSQGWYVAALKIVIAHGRGVSCTPSVCIPERSGMHTASPHQTLGLFDFFNPLLR